MHLHPVAQAFRVCPCCGEASLDHTPENSLVCQSCGWNLFLNPAIGVGAILFNANREVLLIRRAKDPGKGMLAVPGGFVDVGESAEEALQREIREEIGLDVSVFRYLMSHPNTYHFRGVTYAVLDLFFTAELPSLATAQALHEVDSYSILPLSEIDPETMAFPSMRAAMRFFLATLPSNAV